MRFAFPSVADRAQEATTAAVDAQPEAAFEQLAAGPDPALDTAAEALSLYAEYLSELDKVPTLRDPVLPDASGQQLSLDERIRGIVRDELAKMHGTGQGTGRGSARPRKRRKK